MVFIIIGSIFLLAWLFILYVNYAERRLIEKWNIKEKMSVGERSFLAILYPIATFFDYLWERKSRKNKENNKPEPKLINDKPDLSESQIKRIQRDGLKYIDKR